MFSVKNIPTFAKREMDKLQELLLPHIKKASRYGIFAFPLVCIAIINLIMLAFVGSDHIWEIGFVYALMGAIGMALLKESRYQQKEIQKLSSEYILTRIESSHIVQSSVKERYKKLIVSEPIRALPLFVEFLEKEEEMSRRERFA